jgi:hypothetical protein
MIAADSNAFAAARRYDFSGFLDSAWQILGSRLALYASASHVNGCACLAECRRDSAPSAPAGARHYGHFAG